MDLYEKFDEIDRRFDKSDRDHANTIKKINQNYANTMKRFQNQ